MSQNQPLLCCKCEVALVSETVHFHYLKHDFSAEVPRCPVCGQVYLTEDLVRGRVHEVETQLEDK